MSAVVVSLLLALAGPTLLTSTDAVARFDLRGRVVDPLGGVIVGAHVTARSASTREARTTVSDARGEFTLLLEAGVYVVTVAADGFVETAHTVTVGETHSEMRDFVLAIAGVQESVTLTAPLLDPAVVTSTATRTTTPMRDVPQSITVVSGQLMKDQLMASMGAVVQYVPGITAHQGENNRDEIIIRGNRSSADFFVNGVRDDVQYYRDLYNLERVEALKGPNAMIFGRGGAGGVINRVTKEAGFRPLHAITVQGGAFDNARVTADVDQPLGGKVAFRVNGMFEHADSFRQSVGLDRYGVTPTVSWFPGDRTKVAVRYEHLHDRRVADRGITSFQGRPVDVDIATYYGNPDDSRVRADVDVTAAVVEHQLTFGTLRSQTLVGRYDRSYQNYVPGAVTLDRRQVALSAYNNATTRTNVFNQTDLVVPIATGTVYHTLLAGAEVGRQLTDNFRNTGYFNNTATSILVPYGNTMITTPVTFRQSATDADNHLTTTVAAVYAQDQVALTPQLHVVGGVRVDRFDLTYHNNRNGDTLERPDTLVSPRAGVVVKPVQPLSIYGSYSVSYLPSSGDQFSSLTAITQQVKPEKFDNYEVGAKWDVARDLSLTTAVYRLDRTNTRSTDPNDPTRIVQTGSQRTSGYELGANGRVVAGWRVTGGYAYQHAFVTSATTAAPAGAEVAQVPRHTFSLWNSYQLHPRVSAGLGIIRRSDMFAAIDNTVTLPGYTRADAALYVSIARGMRLQANVENVFDKTYYMNADSNTNISPGSPRAVRVALTTTF